MLQRMKELSVQSANGEYNDGVDRAALQLEFEQIQDEIDHIANHTDFNNMMLFDGTGGMTKAELEAIRNSNMVAPTFEEIISEKGGELKNIIYTETVYNFETTQSAAGSDNLFSAEYQAIADELQTSIVPQVVNSVMSTYTAFNYLSGSSIGIGLNLRDDMPSSTLAAVSLNTAYTSSGDAGGNVGGGLISGDLADTDPVPDSDISGLNLFALDTSNTSIKNVYPSEITVLSGGTTSTSGSAPVTSVTPTPSITYPTGLFTVTGGTEGVDWEFDTSTGTLNILTDANLEISGGKLTNADGTYYGNIVIADGVDANITLAGVDIDASQRTDASAGISIGENSTSTITIKGTNTIKSGTNHSGHSLQRGQHIYFCTKYRSKVHG